MQFARSGECEEAVNDAIPLITAAIAALSAPQVPQGNNDATDGASVPVDLVPNLEQWLQQFAGVTNLNKNVGL